VENNLQKVGRYNQIIINHNLVNEACFDKVWRARCRCNDEDHG